MRRPAAPEVPHLPFDFNPAHAALPAHVDAQCRTGVSAVASLNGEVIDEFCTRFADLEAQMPLRPDHIHRAFSNTRLLTSLLNLGCGHGLGQQPGLRRLQRLALAHAEPVGRVLHG